VPLGRRRGRSKPAFVTREDTFWFSFLHKAAHGCALDLPDDTYDVTGSLFGVMLVPDQAADSVVCVTRTVTASAWP
jgi:hypothetical protein